MKGFKRMAAGLLALCLSSSLFMGQALAAVKKQETRTPITSVSIRVRSNVQADYDVEASSVNITTDSGQYTIGAYTWDSGKKDYLEPVSYTHLDVYKRQVYETLVPPAFESALPLSLQCDPDDLLPGGVLGFHLHVQRVLSAGVWSGRDHDGVL